MTRRKTALASIFILAAILIVAAQTRPTISVETQFQRQEDHIDSIDKVAEANAQKIDTLETRLAQAEADINTYRGMIIGFGGLLAALQIVQLVRRKRDD